VHELPQELGRAERGNTGRLTTVEDLQDMTDEQLLPVLLICNLLPTGESLTILSGVVSDNIPLLKDL